MSRPNVLLDDNTQKTHYSIDLRRRKRQKTDHGGVPPASIFQGKQSRAGEKKTENAATERGFAPETHSTPFVALQAESADHVRHRYALYQRVWGHQQQAIEAILNETNNGFFADLLLFIQDPLSPRLDSAFLALSSNTANNLRLLDEFCLYAEANKASAHLKTVRLNSRTCTNIKLAVREMIKQIVQESSADPAGDELPQKEAELDSDSEDDAADSENEGENGDIGNVGEDEDEEAARDALGSRIAYDLEIVQDWMDAYRKKTRCGDALRIAVILEDSDGFPNEVLNQLLQLICIHTDRYPIKMVMALSSRNVSSWITYNVTSKLRTLIEAVKLVAKDNKQIGYQVIDDILLQNEITPENPLLLDAHLSLVILSRFENSNNSIDSLITELRLSYMTHFYQLPLPLLMKPTFVPERFHYDALRKLPSFKTHIEDLVHKLERSPEVEREGRGYKIMRLLQSNKELKELFEEARGRIQKYQNAVMNAVHMVYWVYGGTVAKFEIYKMITNNRLINSVFFSDTLKKFENFDEDDFGGFMSFVSSPAIHDAVGSQTDDDVIVLKQKLYASRAEDAKELITEYFHANSHLNMKTSDNLFHEVLTISGGRSELDELKPLVSIEENYENLAINLIRPNTREIIENNLDEPQKALKNPLVLQSIGQKKVSDVLGPPLCKLYQMYKDAPVSINLWDFFVAFQQSLAKPQLIAEIDRHVQSSNDESKPELVAIMDSVKEDDEAWDKLTYSWFLQGCYELNMMGFLKEKVKGDYMEKLVWKNL